MPHRPRTTCASSQPVWPIAVFDDDVGAYDEGWWYGDADRCSAPVWSERAEAVDSIGQVFLIEHRVVSKGGLLGIVETVENVFVQTGRIEQPSSLLERLRSHSDIPETVLNECVQVSSKGDAGEAIKQIVAVLHKAT